jgi:hypothetical protein
VMRSAAMVVAPLIRKTATRLKARAKRFMGFSRLGGKYTSRF